MTHDAFHTPKSAARNYRNDHKYRAAVNYSGRHRMCDLKYRDWKKKCVVDLVYLKKKLKTYGVSRDNFFFLTVINNVSPFP